MLIARQLKFANYHFDSPRHGYGTSLKHKCADVPHLRPIIWEVGSSMHGFGVMSNTMVNVVFFYCILTLGNSNLNSRKIHLEITTVRGDVKYYV